MTTLDRMTIDELLARFVTISRQQYPLTLNDNFNGYNALFRKLTAIDNELRRRGIEARLALTRLFDHPNIQVRLNAAEHSLAVARQSSLAVLRQITKEDIGPFRLAAGMTVALVEDGTIVPQ